MFGPTHSFAAAFDLWRHDTGARVTVTALLILAAGSVLTFVRLRRAESWAQLSRVDRALSILGILPAALVYYPIVVTATLVGWVLWLMMMLYVKFVRWVERHLPWKSRGQTR